MHRDVKPGNLLRSRDGGQVKLADFGIAKAAEHSDMTKVGSVLGTAAYLSPEQARGEPAGPPRDLYALGVVSYQLLAGRLPYESTSLTELARQQDTQAPTPLHELDPGDPAAALARRGALAGARCPRTGSPTPARWSRRSRPRCAASRPSRRRHAGARRHRRDADARPHVGHHAARAHAGRPRPAPPDGADRGAAAAQQAARRPRRPAPAQAAPRRPGGALRAVRNLLLVALLAGVAAGAYVLITDSSARGVQLKEQVEGNVDQAVQEIQDLLSDNTR